MDEIDSSTGLGASEVAVGAQDGRVVLTFHKPVKYIALDPTVAPQVAEAMMQAAMALGVQISITAPKPHISDEKRLTLAGRVLKVSGDLRKRGRPEPHIAQEITDIILREFI